MTYEANLKKRTLGMETLENRELLCVKPPTLDTSSLGKSQQADAITERSATVYWKDADLPATVNPKTLWYKISVRDSFDVYTKPTKLTMPKWFFD
jgi:hypothetical protein